MQFLADECVDAGVVAELRGAGHDVLYLVEGPRGLADAEVLRAATSDRRVLLTEDKDFGVLAVRRAEHAAGVILLRITPAHRDLKPARLAAAVARYGDDLFGRYTVVELDRIRSRLLLATP